jgi:hypothetical protein
LCRHGVGEPPCRFWPEAGRGRHCGAGDGGSKNRGELRISMVNGRSVCRASLVHPTTKAQSTAPKGGQARGPPLLVAACLVFSGDNGTRPGRIPFRSGRPLCPIHAPSRSARTYALQSLPKIAPLLGARRTFREVRIVDRAPIAEGCRAEPRTITREDFAKIGQPHIRRSTGKPRRKAGLFLCLSGWKPYRLAELKGGMRLISSAIAESIGGVQHVSRGPRTG